MEIVSFQPVANIKGKADKVFEEQRKLILDKLPSAEVHHIGATSIPNSLTKGDLDVNVRVESRDFNNAVEILGQMYEINQKENWTNTFASFKDGNLEIDFGIQLTAIGSPEDNFVAKRDILINNPDLVEKLNELKREFEGKSMEEYRKAKAEFFDNMTK